MVELIAATFTLAIPMTGLTALITTSAKTSHSVAIAARQETTGATSLDAIVNDVKKANRIVAATPKVLIVDRSPDATGMVKRSFYRFTGATTGANATPARLSGASAALSSVSLRSGGGR